MGFFLTYPHCDHTKEELMEFLHGLRTVDKAVVCREEHSDGTPHLHAFVKFEKTADIKKADYFDFKGCHGNY